MMIRSLTNLSLGLSFVLSLLACDSGSNSTEQSRTPSPTPSQAVSPSPSPTPAPTAEVDAALQGIEFPTTYPTAVAGELRLNESGYLSNKEAVIPPQCYTRHEETYNPCMSCHQTYPFGSRPNSIHDGSLQADYAFSDIGERNHWRNLFEDRSEAIAEISTQEVIDYIYTDNYSPLIEQLRNSTDWEGPIPAIAGLERGAPAFDEYGFARDGSHWVAFNYKPQPSTFWPTNGSTDDVIIRLPAEFREKACDGGPYSRDTYIANLAILEAAIKDLPEISLPPVDENEFCADLNADGQLGIISSIRRPEFFVGKAESVAVTPMLYPQGTEFLHTVRYIGLQADGSITLPPRMKEVRYMRKHTFYDIPTLESKYANERQEKIEELPPKYVSRGDQGTNNSFGWLVLGFIEAEGGNLRRQTREEHLFCMGCHTTIGTTIDQTFAFPRKVDGAAGWGYINLRGMPDTPNLDSASGDGEILHYLKTVGGGDEFRQNAEMKQRWFKPDGSVNSEAVEAADVYTLITPSVERALDLNKAYMLIVKDQDFIHGRDATVTPAVNVYEKINPDTAPTLPASRWQQWDIRLNWKTAD